jgi:myo-inositol 2-dehydrogenase/D-chiro-inositol 1-dehydrogenase
MAINDTAVHDIDIARWLLDEEIAATSVLRPKHNTRAAEHLIDPLVVLLETESGVIVDIEVNVNIGYGYDIRGEVVGETGTVSLAEDARVTVKSNGSYGGRVPVDWRERVLAAYDVELQAWLDAVGSGGATGPSAWDGYAATVVSDACLEALRTGQRTTVSLREQPDFYSKPL